MIKIKPSLILFIDGGIFGMGIGIGFGFKMALGIMCTVGLLVLLLKITFKE